MPETSETVLLNVFSVTYKRLFNLGNYENESIELTHSSTPGESLDDVVDAMRVETMYIKKRLDDERRQERETAKTAKSAKAVPPPVQIDEDDLPF